MSIREIIQTIVRQEFAEVYGVPCTVESVDAGENTCVCQPINGDAKFLDIRLKAGTGNGVLMIPAVGSVVIVQPINANAGYVAMMSSIQSIKFLDGSFGGLVKVDDLVTKLNALENAFNTVITWGATVTPPLAGVAPFTPTNSNEIKNDKVTHGTV